MKNKINTAVIALFLAVLFGFGIAFWILPDKDFSPEENRVLQTLPTVKADKWLDGTLSAEFTEYCSDQFPLRTSFVTLHSLYDLALLRGESSGVLCGRDGQQAVRLLDAYVDRTTRAGSTDYVSNAHIDAEIDALSALRDTLDAQDISLVVLPAPRTIDVTGAAFDYPSDLPDALHDRVFGGLDARGVTTVDLIPAFREGCADGEYLMYRTDHHWTTEGAYRAYAALMDALGRGSETVPSSAFTVERVPGFVGTTASRSGFPVRDPDVLEIWAGQADDAYTVRDDKGGTVMTGFVTRSFLDTKDKYGAFMDGTHRLLTVTQTAHDPLSTAEPGEDRPRLLLARDSFASAVIPFLARHYDIVAVNLPGGVTDLSALAAEYGCGIVVVLVNLENYVTSDCIRNIK